MKKVIAWVVSLLLFITPISSTTEERKNTYSFPDLYMEITFPSDFYVLTKNISSDDKALRFLGLSAIEACSYLEENNLYLDAFDAAYNYEILLSSRQSVLIDTINTEDSVFSIFASSIIENYKSYGLSIYQHKVFKHPQTKFLKLYGLIESQSVSFLEYITVMNGKEISIVIRIGENISVAAAETFIDMLISYITFQDMNKVAAQHYETIDSFNIKYISDFSLRNGIAFNMVKEDIIALEKEMHDVEPTLWDSDWISYSSCNVENYSDGHISYNFNSEGKLYHIEYGLGWEDEPERISIVKNNYANIAAEMERRYGPPRNQDDGLIFPLLSETLDGWITTPYCFQGYKQWIIECKDYYVLAEIILTKTSLSSTWRCDASYTMYEKDDISPVLDKNRRIF